MTTERCDAKSESRARRPQYQFHPFEIAFSGHSGSGKTTLITKLVEKLSSTYSIGYVKHDAHKFQMDHEGKDTHKVWSSGAAKVFISDSQHTVLISSGTEGYFHQNMQFVSCDFVILEGYKNIPIDKILVLDEEEKILEELPKNALERVVACVGQQNISSHPVLQVPYFHRDDVSSILSFIEERFADRIRKIPLFGLVLTGGYSTRMETDKGKLVYHGKPQAEVCYDLLSGLCEKVYISTRRGQYEKEFLQGFPKLYDRFSEFGPLGGVLTAMVTYPNASWYVLACDMPHINRETLQVLVQNRDPLKMATTYLSAEDGLPEPLCAIYEPKARVPLLERLGFGFECPRKFLINSPCKGVPLQDREALKNVNDRESYEQVIK
ncbi:MAG: Molybdopterin-guanine dinucleotide biosynthesis adapter protein [Chlamydiae bacterium]|nr:Molybdopterin-guanine dinucleotide biosynthesis adapter protein [Chlamydiota bacterium]